MNLYNYIDQYGEKSWDEVPFNEIDAMIFSYLPYADFRKVFGYDEKLSLSEVSKRHSVLYSDKKVDITAVKEARQLLYTIDKMKRYKNCLLFHYDYIGNRDLQFGALSIEYAKNRVFVAFEGTDAMFSGWIENFILSYRFPTMSHEKAIQYLNKYYTFSNQKLIVGGHSKGGNLALVASMYSHFLVRKRIQKIYSGDGPGLLINQFSSRHYRDIQKKYIHIIPNYSVVGVLLNHSSDCVVSASTKSILSHSILYWNINGTSFQKTTLSSFSKELDQRISTWLEKTNMEEKKSIIDNFNQILRKANISDINELKQDKKKVLALIQESRDIHSDSKKAIDEFVQIIIQCLEKTTQEEFRMFFKHSFRKKEK